MSWDRCRNITDQGLLPADWDGATPYWEERGER